MKEYPILKELLPALSSDEIHKGKNYPRDDGHKSMPSYRIWFRGQSRKMGDLTREELLCALLDAQNDLELICKKVPIDICFEGVLDSFPALTQHSRFHDILKRLADIDVVAWRHRTDRGEDEELNRAERAAPPPTPKKSIVRENAERDPNYCPYCMRCSGLVRMRKTDVPFLWRCSCGAIGDDRTPEEIDARPSTPSQPYASGQVPDEGDVVILRPRTGAPYKRREESTATVRVVDIPDLPEVIEVDWHSPHPLGIKDNHVYVRDLTLVQRACHEG